MGDDEVSLEPGCYRGDIAAVLTPAGTIARVPLPCLFTQYSLGISPGNCVVDYFEGFPSDTHNGCQFNS